VSKAETKARLVEVKLALARKYENLARVAKSTPGRKTCMFHATRFRRQAANLTRQ
jgi:hypothetical protein